MTGQDYGQQGPLNIIIVEDSAVDAELVADALREAGLTVDMRRVDEEAALRAALDERLPDAILADWTLPRFSGRRALEIVRERWPDVPLIFVSGTISEDSACDSLSHGAIDYVYKHQLQRLGHRTAVGSRKSSSDPASLVSGRRGRPRRCRSAFRRH